MYRLTTKKLSEVELDPEELSTKFENNFLVEKTKKLEAELFQVRAQLERTSSAKFDEMLSLQKSTSDRTGLGFSFSSSNIASISTIVFVPPSIDVEIENNNVKIDLASENLDKGKSILEAPPKQDKHPLNKIRTKLRTLGLKRLTLKSLNRRSSISIIVMELPVILNQIAISG